MLQFMVNYPVRKTTSLQIFTFDIHTHFVFDQYYKWCLVVFLKWSFLYLFFQLRLISTISITMRFQQKLARYFFHFTLKLHQLTYTKGSAVDCIRMSALGRAPRISPLLWLLVTAELPGTITPASSALWIHAFWIPQTGARYFWHKNF